MARETKIEWADSTLNLQMGCDGCELWNEKTGERKCYAGQITERYGGKPGWPDSFTQPKLFLERLTQLLKWPDLTGKPRKDKPWLNGYPRMVFLDDMGDTFTESLPLNWLAQPWTNGESPLDLMGRTPHVYMLLTKRSNRMRQFSKRHPFPGNFWLFTSVTDKSTIGRVADLLQVRGGSIRGVSYEPALGPVDFGCRNPLCPHDPSTCQSDYCPCALDLIIVGGESGPGARPLDIRWARDTVRQCKAAGVACFVKQLGAKPYEEVAKVEVANHAVYGPEVTRYREPQELRLRDKKGGAIEEWPDDLKIRELPACR